MKYYYTYILLCSDGSYYTGVTNNIEKRLYEHQNGLIPSCYTLSRRPVRVVFHQAFRDVRYALLAEKQIKGWSRKKKEALMAGDFERIKELAKSSKRECDSVQPENK
jgi:putative endonuclease